MSKSSLDATALAATLVAAAAALLLLPTGLAWMTSILGLILLVVLLSFDEEGYRSITQSLGFAGACAFCFTVASIIPYQFIYGLPTPHEPQLVNRWLPMTWAFVTLLILVIDRARMGARTPTAQPGAATLGSVLSPRVSAPMPVAMPDFQPPPASTLVEPIEAPTPHLVRDEPVIRTAPPPKLVEIYVHLTGESLNLMRSVQAEPLGRDYYRITDTMPDNEVWQFVPGQVVRCKKQNLSTGKALVAVEEAPRAQ